MALNLNSQFSPRINPPDANYPTGSFKDSTAPGVFDGTPLESVDRNDWQGFSDALLTAAGITADGIADTALVSQRFQALLQMISGLTPISGGGPLEINKRYLILDELTYTLPDTTNLTIKQTVEVYKLAAAETPLIQVDGTNSEEINFYDPNTGFINQTDTSVIYNIFVPIIFVFNTDWEL